MLRIENSEFKNNVFIGPDSSLLYIENAFVSAFNNKFEYNGYLSG